MSVEPAWIFYPKQVKIVLSTGWKWFVLGWKLNQLRRKIEKDPSRLQYSDVALMPPTSQSKDHLDPYQTYNPLLGIKLLAK